MSRSHLYMLFSVEARTTTWTKDSHGLFDYESASVMRDKVTAVQSSRLQRIGNRCAFATEETAEGAETLLLLSQRNGEISSEEFSVRPGTAAEKLWLVVKETSRDRGVRLVEGDVMKLGRILYRVKQLSTEGGTKPTFPSLSLAVPVEVYDRSQTGEANLVCRICLGDAQSEDNPMISPCKCAGTMKFIHIDCLQEWLKSRLNCQESGSAVSYFWQTLDCELCKQDFPTTIQINGATRDLVEIHKPNSAFLVLEDLRRENSSRGIHVVSMDEGHTFCIGRGHDCDIRITDISVSRLHAVVRLSQGGFFVEDRNSKFGTLVQVKQPVTLTLGVSVALQVSRTVVVLRVKRPWRLMQCCRCLRRSDRPATGKEPSRPEKIDLSSDERQNTVQREDLPALQTGEAPREATSAFFQFSQREEVKDGEADCASP